MVMDDKERIEYIILEKQLTDGDFCAKAGISAATLSHIKSGRSRPSLTILRGVVEGFPDLNPEWVLLGRGEMYSNSTPSTNVGTESDENAQSEVHDADNNIGLFSGVNDMFSSSSASSPQQTSRLGERAQPNAALQRQQMAERMEQAKVNVAEVVRETLAQTQKPQRKIVEVRIFFDDGTYETFGQK